MDVTDFGFTGSREDPSSEQKHWLLGQVTDMVVNHGWKRAHHGCCMGSDEFFHKCCKRLMDAGLEDIVLHPPTDRSREMEITEWDLANCLWYPRKPYLMRNKDIAKYSSRLLALPKTPQPADARGSGTWHTIRKALERRGMTVKLCYPDGETDELPR